MWIATRSRSRAYCPGALDTFAGGGHDITRTAFETAVQETHEEAGLAITFARTHLVPRGVVSLDDRDQPSINFCYDMPLRLDQTPRPVDGEVERFELTEAHQLLDALHAGRFMPDAALVVIDFAIRHGIINAENEPHYASLCCAVRDPSVIPAGL